MEKRWCKYTDTHTFTHKTNHQLNIHTHTHTHSAVLRQWVFIYFFDDLQKNIQNEKSDWDVRMSMKKGASRQPHWQCASKTVQPEDDDDQTSLSMCEFKTVPKTLGTRFNVNAPGATAHEKKKKPLNSSSGNNSAYLYHRGALFLCFGGLYLSSPSIIAFVDVSAIATFIEWLIIPMCVCVFAICERKANTQRNRIFVHDNVWADRKSKCLSHNK